MIDATSDAPQLSPPLWKTRSSSDQRRPPEPSRPLSPGPLRFFAYHRAAAGGSATLTCTRSKPAACTATGAMRPKSSGASVRAV